MQKKLVFFFFSDCVTPKAKGEKKVGLDALFVKKSESCAVVCLT